MKALPMFDHVMLWVARRFTSVFAVIFAAPLIASALSLVLSIILFCFEQCLLQANPHLRTIPEMQASHWFPLLPHALTDPSAFLASAWLLIWFASVRLLSSTPARICLGISSLFFAVIAFDVFSALLTASFTASSEFSFAAFFLSLFFFVGFLAFASMTWISVRPPQNSNSPVIPKSHSSLQSC
jgi:hypothetical protein